MVKLMLISAKIFLETAYETQGELMVSRQNFIVMFRAILFSAAM